MQVQGVTLQPDCNAGIEHCREIHLRANCCLPKGHLGMAASNCFQEADPRLHLVHHAGSNLRNRSSHVIPWTAHKADAPKP